MSSRTKHNSTNRKINGKSISLRSKRSSTTESSSNLINYTEEQLSLSSSEDEIAFTYFYHDKMERDNIDDNSESEMKARSLWKNLDYKKKKSFLKEDDYFHDDDDRSSDEAAAAVPRSSSLSDNNNKRLSSSPKRMKRDNHSSNNANQIAPIIAKSIDYNHQRRQSTESSSSDNNNNNNSNNHSSIAAQPVFQMEVQRLIASPAQYLHQPVCVICETYSDDSSGLVVCTDRCKRYFHLDCIEDAPGNYPESQVNFKCVDCFSKKYRCAVCRLTENIDSLLHCEQSDCGRLYHRKCLAKENFTGLEIIDKRIRRCPAHFCISCARENSSFAQSTSKKLIECLRCPFSFHCNDLCMAAGAFELSLSHVICPRHFQKKLINMTTYKPCHPNWCFKCFKIGVKLMCHYCPASYHLECVAERFEEVIDKNHRVFVCRACGINRHPRYGQVLFVKVSQYRWWPCEVIHPRNAPMNILKLNRPDGTYPVLFLGSNEYQWVARTRSIDYNTAQMSTIFRDTGGTNKMDREFTLGLKNAAKIHQIFVNILRSHVPLRSINAPPMTDQELHPYINVKEINHKTVKFKLIKANIVIPPAKLPQKVPQAVCDCTDSCQPFQCKNHLRHIECNISSCPSKTRCYNQQFTNYVNKNLAVFKTSNRGFGFKTTAAINQNDFIIEYLGELITRAESIFRIHNSKKLNQKDLYMVKLSPDLIIDAGPKGNLSRYINHSCDPNCYLEKWIVSGTPKIGVFALKDIEPDQELTFDYRISGVLMKEDTFCLCGTTKCTGFLGPIKSLPGSPLKPVVVPAPKSTVTPTVLMDVAVRLTAELPKEIESTPTDKEKTKQIEDKLKMKDEIDTEEINEKSVSNDRSESMVNVTDQSDQSIEFKTLHENFCYRCYDTGDLVLCEKDSCPKTYHLSCLGLRIAPSGTWYCPWHFCDICGKSSQVFCLQCPRSFCHAHADNDKIVPPKPGSRTTVCRHHHKDAANFSNRIVVNHKRKSNSGSVSCSSKDDHCAVRC